jgi:hypothetical protein
MKDSIAKITKWILYVLLAMSAISGLFFYINLMSLDLFINIGIFILIIGILIMIISPVYGFITNPQNMKILLVSLLLGVVILVISYLISGNELSSNYLEQYNTTANDSRIIGMGLIATYIMFALSLLTFLYSAIIKAIK